MARYLIVFMMVPLLLGCGQSPATRARAAAAAKRHADHIAKLKSYVPANVLKTVDPEFYTYAGFRDWSRFPLVYPYSICGMDNLDVGCLCRHDGKSRISDGKDEQLEGLHFLTAFSFDAHFLVGSRDEAWPDGNGALTWVLVDFANGTIESFPSKDQVAAAAKARGYSGDLEFADIRTRFDECFGE